MLDNLLGRNIALCDAGVGIGKTYAYLVACVLMRKYSLLAEGCSPYEQRRSWYPLPALHSRKQFLQNISLFSPGFFRRTGRFRPLLKLWYEKERAFCLRWEVGAPNRCNRRKKQKCVAERSSAVVERTLWYGRSVQLKWVWQKDGECTEVLFGRLPEKRLMQVSAVSGAFQRSWNVHSDL